MRAELDKQQARALEVYTTPHADRQTERKEGRKDDRCLVDKKKAESVMVEMRVWHQRLHLDFRHSYLTML
jgi:hypothetical protein